MNHYFTTIIFSLVIKVFFFKSWYLKSKVEIIYSKDVLQNQYGLHVNTCILHYMRVKNSIHNVLKHFNIKCESIDKQQIHLHQIFYL